MKKNILFAVALLVSVISYAQTPNGFLGIGTTDPKAKLQIVNDSSGILIPKYATLALANSNSLPKLNATDHKGLMIFINEAANQGFWFYNGTAFEKVGSIAASGPVLDLDVQNTVSQTMPVGGTSVIPSDIIFNNVVKTPSISGASYNNFTGVYTVGQTGYYLINVNILTTNPASIATCVIPDLVVNDISKVYGVGYVNATALFSARHGRGTLSTVIKLNSGDLVKIKGVNGSTLYTASLSIGGQSTFFTITKL
jgi:hypothetical protein